METSIDALRLSLPDIAPHSAEEAQLFVSGVFGHLVMGFPLTERVTVLRQDLATHEAFRALVVEAMGKFASEGTLSEEGRCELVEFLRL